MIDIDEMPAGIELDTLMAEALGYIRTPMTIGEEGIATETEGLVFIVVKGVSTVGDDRVYVRRTIDGQFTHFAPSTDIAAAFQVVDKLLDGTRVFELESYMPKDDGWQATFKGKLNWEAARYEQLVYAYAETISLAICRAALEVMAE